MAAGPLAPGAVDALRALTGELAADYDLLIMDCAPSISLASENVFRASDALLVPLIPSPLSLRTLRQLRRYLRAKGPEHLSMLAFFSMADSRKVLHKQTLPPFVSTRTAREPAECPPA